MEYATFSLKKAPFYEYSYTILKLTLRTLTRTLIQMCNTNVYLVIIYQTKMAFKLKTTDVHYTGSNILHIFSNMLF